jgi:uncharacterized protein involved in exopolysaccharide biosynthesis
MGSQLMVRLLETFFRHKVLILLPTFLIPLIVGPIAVLSAPTFYVSGASVWVDKPTYLAYNDDWNGYLTPAQNQSARLGQLLRTSSFLVDVANRTSLAPLTATSKGQQRIQRLIGSGFSMAPNGNNLLVVQFRAPTPQLAFEILNAVVETYKDRTADDRVNQAGIATSFYESRLATAEQDLTKVNDDLKRYIAANPRLTAIDPDAGAAATTASRLGLPPSAVDPTLGSLLRELELRQKAAEQMRTSLEQSRLTAAAALEGQELGFQIVDAPQVPKEATRQRRKALMYPAAGFLVGFGLSATLLVLLAGADHSVRSEADLGPNVRVLGLVPRLRLKGLPKATGPETARRAIAFPAGAVLPALPAPQGAR